MGSELVPFRRHIGNAGATRRVGSASRRETRGLAGAERAIDLRQRHAGNEAPETRYTQDGGVHIAYQTTGDHGSDLLLIPTPTFPIDLIWDEPHVAAQLSRLASFSRLIMTDLLGVGSSDQVAIHDCPAMQSWTDGLIAVLDAAGSAQASIFATAESALPAMLLAATHPDRVSSLVLWSAFARFSRAVDYPWGMPEPALSRYVDLIGDAYGTGVLADHLAPTWVDGTRRRWWARGERLSGGPGYFKRIYDLYVRSDLRPVLDSIRVPTLLLHRRGDHHVVDGHGRYLADRIPNARLVEFDGEDHVWFAGQVNAVLDEIQEFLTGQRASAPTHRVLATVLFTDIVRSTELAACLGDREWAKVLGEHNRLVERHVAAARGTVVKFTGDGALASFDGPARAINCACAIRDAVRELGFAVRVGLHTGEVESVGADIHGIAVHIAARIMALAAPDEVLVSGAVPPLVLGSTIAFEDRGTLELKGVPGRWSVMAVRDTGCPCQ